MQAWLAANWPLIFAVVVALSSGWIGLNRKRDRELKECRETCKKQVTTIRRLKRDYLQVLEFNYQDRYTIREMGLMIRDYRLELKLPEEDILLTLSIRAEAEMKARRLSARQGAIHQTLPPPETDEYDLDLT